MDEHDPADDVDVALARGRKLVERPKKQVIVTVSLLDGASTKGESFRADVDDEAAIRGVIEGVTAKVLEATGVLT